VTADEETIGRLREFGENVGMVFQIRDDLLDYTGRKSITGKPAGLDMKEKKLTLPLIHSFTQAPHGRSRAILRIIKNGSGRRELQSVVEFAHEFGGIDYATRKAEEYSERALRAIEPLPESPSKDSLRSFVGFVLERSK
jgi:octaprenyl-diphosphate synthase